MKWLFFFMVAIFVFLGVAIHVFKWYFLISGYNTMSKEKKKNVDTTRLGKLIGFYCYFNAFLFFLLGVMEALEIKAGMPIVFFLFGLSTIYVMIKAQRYDGNLFDENGKLRKGALKQVAVPLVIVGLTFVGVAAVLFYFSQPVKISFADEGLQIHGMYGELYRWESIEEVQLKEELPKIEIRTNGVAVGSRLTGHFRTTEYGAVKLFIDAKVAPFIYLKSDGKMIIFNLSKRDETEAVYEEIMKRWDIKNGSDSLESA